MELAHEPVERLEPDEAVEQMHGAISELLKKAALCQLEDIREGGEGQRQRPSTSSCTPLHHLDDEPLVDAVRCTRAPPWHVERELASAVRTGITMEGDDLAGRVARIGDEHAG